MAARIPDILKYCGVDITVPMPHRILRRRVIPTGNQLLCYFANVISTLGGVGIASSEGLVLEEACWRNTRRVIHHGQRLINSGLIGDYGRSNAGRRLHQSIVRSKIPLRYSRRQSTGKGRQIIEAIRRRRRRRRRAHRVCCQKVRCGDATFDGSSCHSVVMRLEHRQGVYCRREAIPCLRGRRQLVLGVVRKLVFRRRHSLLRILHGNSLDELDQLGLFSDEILVIPNPSPRRTCFKTRKPLRRKRNKREGEMRVGGSNSTAK